MGKREWALRDVRAEGVEHLPTPVQLANIRKGDFVKVAFDFGERCWVEVRELTAGGGVGVLRNQPTDARYQLQWGAVISFEHRHIMVIERA